MTDVQKLLREQAWSYAKEQNSKTFQDFLSFFEDKFTELIVEECADIAKYHAMNISTYADADFVYEQIKRHFGVEE